ncbi:hypothetical protein B7494_g5071 [Chlorociboria aeruginascens]|nr:hypothetical protein B7494_g5071 [Chlorociboria aeruginascens]
MSSSESTQSQTQSKFQAQNQTQTQTQFTFLSLAPSTSASYPTKPTTEEMQSAKTSRSSSLSSVGDKKRFLKLGPVHFGEGDGTGDWFEEE